MIFLNCLVLPIRIWCETIIFPTMVIAIISIIIILSMGSIWAYYRYLLKLKTSGKPYKVGGDMMTFVFTLPLSFIIAEVIRDKFLSPAMSQGFGLQMIFVLLIVIANYAICLGATAVAKQILERRNRLN